MITINIILIISLVILIKKDIKIHWTNANKENL